MSSNNINNTANNRNQKNLLNYFSVQKDGEKDALCSGCGVMYPITKINMHRDFECVVVVKEIKNSKFLSSKKNKRSKENLKKRKPNIESSEIYLSNQSSSNNASILSQSRNIRESTPPIFDLVESINKEEKLIDTLMKDWDTPIKSRSDENGTVNDITKGTSISCTETVESDKILLDDIDCRQDTNDKSISSLLSGNNSEDDFQKDEVIFSSPFKRNIKEKKPIIKNQKKSLVISNEESCNSDDDFIDMNIVFSSPKKNPISKTKKSPNIKNNSSVNDNQQIDKDSKADNSYEESPLKTPTLVSPERTPTPSPKFSRKIMSNVKLSPNLQNYPNKFSLSVNSDEEMFPQSSQSSSTKKTPRHILKALQKTSLQNGYISSPLKVRRHLFPSQESNSNTQISQEKKYLNKYRGEKGMYLENFLYIMETVISQPEDIKLFNDEDLNIITTFNGLTLEAQKLYVRLFTRKIKWNKVCKLEYKEICDKEDMQLYINELNYARFLDSESSIKELKDLLAIMDLNELKKLSKHMKLPTVGTKEALISKLLKSEKQQHSFKLSFKMMEQDHSQLFKITKELVGKCFIVNKNAWSIFMRLLQLYSPVRFEEEEENGQQAQLTMLLMVRIGKMKFPDYEIKRNNSIYKTRDDLILCHTCLLLEYEIQDFIRKQDWEGAINMCKQSDEIMSSLEHDPEILTHDKSLPPHLRRYTTLSILHHIRSLAVEVYERQRHYGKAVKALEQLLGQKTYLQDYRGRWYDRMALNLHQHLKKVNKCMEVIKEALEDPEVKVGHRLALSQRAEKIMMAKKNSKVAESYKESLNIVKYQEAPKVIIQGKSLPSDIPGYKRIFIRTGDADGDTMCSVEELVLAHYKDEGYPKGLHCEGRTANALFGFFMWDILYLSVPDAFRSPNQAAPLDLDYPEFYENRKRHIDKRLKQIRKWTLEEANKEVEKIWNKFIDVVCLIDWKIFSSLEFLQGLIAGLGLDLIAALCERLAKNHRFTRSGFPDLIVWNPIEKTSRIVEVKGPNDKLSTKQILWLDYLLKNGANAEVCHVEAIGMKRSGALKSKRVSPRINQDQDSQVSTSSSDRLIQEPSGSSQPTQGRTKRRKVH